MDLVLNVRKKRGFKEHFIELNGLIRILWTVFEICVTVTYMKRIVIIVFFVVTLSVSGTFLYFEKKGRASNLGAENISTKQQPAEAKSEAEVVYKLSLNKSLTNEQGEIFRSYVSKLNGFSFARGIDITNVYHLGNILHITAVTHKTHSYSSSFRFDTNTNEVSLVSSDTGFQNIVSPDRRYVISYNGRDDSLLIFDVYKNQKTEHFSEKGVFWYTIEGNKYAHVSWSPPNGSIFATLFDDKKIFSYADFHGFAFDDSVSPTIKIYDSVASSVIKSVFYKI